MRMRAVRRCLSASIPRPALASAVMLVAACAAAPALSNDMVRARYPAPSAWELTLGPTLRGRSPDLAPRSFDLPGAGRPGSLMPDVQITPVLPGTTTPSQGRTWAAPGEVVEERKQEMFGAKVKLPF